MTLTKKLPTKEGMYWWTNFGEHTPCILRVSKQRITGGDEVLWAKNEYFSFQVCLPENIYKGHRLMVDGYFYGEELWAYIPNPTLSAGKVIKYEYYNYLTRT